MITVVEGSERFVSITTTTEVTMVADSSALCDNVVEGSERFVA